MEQPLATSRSSPSEATRGRRRGFSWRRFILTTPMWVVGVSIPLAAISGPFVLVLGPTVGVIGSVVTSRNQELGGQPMGFLAVLGSLLSWAIVISIGYAGYSLLSHLKYGSSYCGEVSPNRLKQVSCIGRDHSMLQGRLNYSEIHGHANGAACRTVYERTEIIPWDDSPDNSSRHDGTWHNTTCPTTWPVDWKCEETSNLSGGGDLRAQLVGYSPDCAQARAWTSTNVPWKEFDKKMARVRQSSSSKSR